MSNPVAHQTLLPADQFIHPHELVALARQVIEQVTEAGVERVGPGRAGADVEQEDPHGLNGFILLLHIGSGPGRQDKFPARFGELLDYLAGKGYGFVRVDELLRLPEP